MSSRTKEVGIRKVLGATTTGILGLLSKEFLGLVVVANLVACPVAYFLMKRWLDNFAFKVEIGVDVFVLAGAIAVMTSIATISYQATKSAFANPVDALRYE